MNSNKTKGVLDILDGMASPLPLPSEYQYYNSLEKNCILINEAIDENIIETACIPLMQMDKNPEVKEITILLSTCGGNIYYGFVLCDVIEKLQTKTNIIIMGLCASMGSLIAMSGHNNKNVTTKAFKSSVGLIHSGSEYLEGSSHSVRDTFKFTERYEEYIKDYVLSHTNFTEDFYKEIERQEYWMTTQDMLDHEIIDIII